MLIFKAIVLCELYNLSDEQFEYQVRDRRPSEEGMLNPAKDTEGLPKKVPAVEVQHGPREETNAEPHAPLLDPSHDLMA